MRFSVRWLAVWLAVQSLAVLVVGCDPDPDPSDGGMDAGALEGGVDAGQACASHAECVESARSEGHTRRHCIAGRCAEACAASPDCAGHPSGPMCVSERCGCAADPDCGGFPVRCFAARCAECVEAGDCVLRATPLCAPDGRCVRCLTDAECGPDRTCDAGACVGADDLDGDGFTADDCDDMDADRRPGALPVCGNGTLEGCPGAWGALATQLGVAEAGQHPLRRVLGPGPDGTQITSVAAASLPSEAYVAFVFRGPGSPGVTEPRVARLIAVPLDGPQREITLPHDGLDCGGASPVTLDNVDRVSVAVAADGAVHLVSGATVGSAPTLLHYLVHYTVTAGAPTVAGCELADDQSQFGYAAVGVAAETEAAGGVMTGVTGSRDNVFHALGAPTATHFRSRDWLDGQGAVVATRSRPTAGGPISLHFILGGGVIEESVATVASTFDRGRAALAAAPGGEYAIVLPTNERTYLVEGRCAGASCGPAATGTTWDLAVENVPDAHWVGTGHFAVAHVDYVESPPGTNAAQIHLRGFARSGRPLPADLVTDAPVLASRIEIPGPGSLIVRDVDVSARADRVDVAFLAQSNSGNDEVYLRSVRLCAAE